ncbi:MAG: RraA family protein [Pseudomonadota bacterium]
MIEEPPLLQVKRADRRPTEEQIAAIAACPTGFLCDAMDGKGALSPDLGWLDADLLPTAFCGVALTSENGPDDILGIMASLAMVQPGDVVVAGTSNWRGSAAAGDRVMGMMKNGGAVGFVTDGLVRDHEGIVPVGLPVFCAGLNPNSPYANGPAKVGTPIVLGGVPVATGDIIAADRSGVVVVPFERIDAVIATVRRITSLEEELDAKVAAGQKVPGAIEDLLASDKVRWL